MDPERVPLDVNGLISEGPLEDHWVIIGHNADDDSYLISVDEVELYLHVDERELRQWLVTNSVAWP